MSKCEPIGRHVLVTQTWNPVLASPTDEIDYVDLSSIDNNVKQVSDVRRVLGKDAPSRARQLIRSGDILVSTVRPNLNGVAIVPRELDGATASTGFTVLRANEVTLSAQFLYHWVKTPAFVSDMVRKATGQSYPAVSDRIILESIMPVPRIEEQRRIAAILDQAEALRAKRRQALAKLDTLTQSLFLEMFGDPDTDHGDERTTKIGDVCTRITYGFTSPMRHIQAGVPILTAKHIQRGWIDFSTVHYAEQKQFDELTAKCKPSKGDVLITKDGTIGRCAVLHEDDPVCINQSVALVQLDRARILPEFFSAFVNLEQTQRKLDGMGKGNSIKHLQITEFARYSIVVPSLQLQDRFLQRVEMVSSLKKTVEIQSERMEMEHRALQHRAFRGEL